MPREDLLAEIERLRNEITECDEQRDLLKAEVERLQGVLRTQVRVNAHFAAREVDQWEPLLAAVKDYQAASMTYAAKHCGATSAQSLEASHRLHDTFEVLREAARRCEEKS